LASHHHHVARARWAEHRAAQRRAGAADPLPAFRVEHRGAGGTTVLGTSEGHQRHRTALEPYASQLWLAGHWAGELALVEATTGQTVARLALGRRPRPGAWR
jgi:hypothetical protein